MVRSLSFCGSLCLCALLFGAQCKRPDGRKVLTLEVTRAFDERLPYLSDADMAAVLKEGQAVITAKLSGSIALEFRDNGRQTAQGLFESVSYRDSSFYRGIAPFRYSLERGAADPLYATAKYRESLQGFLKGWSLPALARFYPTERVGNYDEAARATLSVYHAKVDWLKSLKAPDGTALLRQPPVPYQSYTEWLGMMAAQTKFDVVFTNTLILLDTANNPYPHSITKHAKVGGSSFDSPGRPAMGGRSVMVNTIEEFGGVKGISRDRKISRELRNKLVGAVLFAHEFAHAFYLIPDVYDHPASCLMNTTMENLDMEKAYELLKTDNTPCAQCRPYVRSKMLEIRAQAAASGARYTEAADLCLQALDILPERLDMDRRARVVALRTCARDAFARAGNKERVRQLELLLK